MEHPTDTPRLDLDALKAEAHRLGFEVAGVAPIGGDWFTPHQDRFSSWLAHEKHGTMTWLADRAAQRLDPSLLLANAQCAVALWMPHRTPTPPRPTDPAHPTGRVASYAWGRDYHNVTLKPLRKLRRWISAQRPGTGVYLSVDTGAILERAFAEAAGLGWIGRSAMVIHPRLGTYGVLSVMLLDVPLPISKAPVPFRCGTCTDCVTACPTGAITDAGVDARRCISYWTIEHRGLIPAEIRPGLGEWLFGCDLCQEVCPWNRRAPLASAALWRPVPTRAWPELHHWLVTPPDILQAELSGSPLRRPGMEGLKRNALIVTANGGYRMLLDTVRAVARDSDSAVLRATAIWAARTLGCPDAAALARLDPHPMVQREAATVLPAARPCAN